MEFALVAIALVLVLLGLAGARRQIPVLRQLPAQRLELPRADYLYARNQAWRRLAGCALLWLMAAMLVVNLATDLEGRADRLALTPKPLVGADRDVAHAWVAFWGSFLSLLMVLVLLAAWEVWAIRRYALRHLRQINADRREMIEHELAVYRSQRNGQARRSSDPSDIP